MSKTITPTVWLSLLRRERANWLGRYPSFCAARSMHFLVTAGMYRANGALLSTIDTVVEENPLSFATSRMVTIAAFALPNPCLPNQCPLSGVALPLELESVHWRTLQQRVIPVSSARITSECFVWLLNFATSTCGSPSEQ